MNKVKQSDKNIAPFGGLNFIYEVMNRIGLDKFLDKQIGYRHFSAQYSYSDIVYSLFGNAFTQGSFVADLETLKEKYSKQVFNKIPSPDTQYTYKHSKGYQPGFAFVGRIPNSLICFQEVRIRIKASLLMIKKIQKKA